VYFAVQNAEKYPPPWLIAMQRYGPPPSYPTLKIAGLTAPIPEVCLLLLSLLLLNSSLCSIMWSRWKHGCIYCFCVVWCSYTL